MEINKSNTSVVLVRAFLAADNSYIGCNVRFNSKDGLTCHQSGVCRGADYKKCSVCG